MNAEVRKRLEEMQAEARTVPLSEKERWLIAQLEVEAADVEQLQVVKYPGCKVLSLGDACTCKICMLEKRVDAAEADAARQRERVDALEGCVTWLLPMAKGYAATHPIGNNWRKITHAKTLLSPIPSVEVGSLWDYDRSLCHSANTVALKVKSIKDGYVQFEQKMAYEGYSLEYFNGKIFRLHAEPSAKAKEAKP